jgi:hypothetical protein
MSALSFSSRGRASEVGPASVTGAIAWPDGPRITVATPVQDRHWLTFTATPLSQLAGSASRNASTWGCSSGAPRRR